MKHEIHSLTGLRGIAAFYVIAFHFMKEYFVNNYEVSPTVINFIFKNIIAHGYLAVDIFFILSSFVLCLSYQDYFNDKIKLNSYWIFIKKRFQRIYLVYFICILVTMIIFKNFSIYNFLLESLLLHAYTDINLYNYNVATWSLSIEWTIYLIFPFILFAFQKLSKISLFALFIFSILILFYIQVIKPPIFSMKTLSIDVVEPSYNLNVHFGFPALIRALTMYFFGFLIYKYHNFFNHKILFTTSIIGIFIVMMYNFNDVFIIIYFLFFFPGLLKENIISKFLQLSPIKYLGKISYSLYLFHIVIIGIMRAHNLFSTINTASFYLLAVILSILFAAFSYEVFEKRLTKIIFKKV